MITGARRTSFASTGFRPSPQVAVGRFGAVVFHPTLGDGSVRRAGSQWEVNLDGGWQPMEVPLRTRRDEAVIESVRPDELEFVVNVYAAVVTAPHSLGSMAGCTVLQPHQILPYLAALPQASAAS